MAQAEGGILGERRAAALDAGRHGFHEESFRWVWSLVRWDRQAVRDDASGEPCARWTC